MLNLASTDFVLLAPVSIDSSVGYGSVCVLWKIPRSIFFLETSTLHRMYYSRCVLYWNDL